MIRVKNQLKNYNCIISSEKTPKMAVDRQGHRPSSLKQANKSHKHGGHRSKRSVDQANKGRVSVKATTMKAKREMRREERRHQATQVRKIENTKSDRNSNIHCHIN